MQFMRFSLIHLLVFVGVLAAALAGMKGASNFWSSLVFNVTVGVLIIASFSAWYSDGIRKAFRGGFAVVGWTYLLVSVLPAFSRLRQSLLTHDIFGRVIPYLRPDAYERDPGGNIVRVDSSITDRCYEIGMCLEVLLVALLGGALAAFLASRRQRPGVSNVSER